MPRRDHVTISELLSQISKVGFEVHTLLSGVYLDLAESATGII